jgi:hypothetical protein
MEGELVVKLLIHLRASEQRTEPVEKIGQHKSALSLEP